MRARRPMDAATSLATLVGITVTALAMSCSQGADSDPARTNAIASRTPGFNQSSRAASSSRVSPSSSNAPSKDISPLVTGVIEDQCVLTAAEFSALAGRQSNPGETSTGTGQDTGSRDCWYVAMSGRAALGRINVYGSNGPPPPELLQRAIGKVAGSRPLAAVGKAAVILPDGNGRPGMDLWVATDRHVVQIHVVDNPPDDARWTSAGTAAANRLPA